MAGDVCPYLWYIIVEELGVPWELEVPTQEKAATKIVGCKTNADAKHIKKSVE